MPRLRTLALALAVGLAVGLYAQRWVGAPTFLAVAVAGVMILFVLLIAASVGDDDAAAEAAWRAAAPDLASREPGRRPFVAGGDERGPASKDTGGPGDGSR